MSDIFLHFVADRQHKLCPREFKALRW